MTLAFLALSQVIVMETNPFMKTSLSDLVHSRNEAYKRLSLEADLLEERLAEAETAVSALAAGRLSQSVLPPETLRRALFDAEQSLPEGFGLLFPSSGPLWPYYSELRATAALDGDLDQVKVVLAVPLVDMASTLDLHKVIKRKSRLETN